jgi:hypothetical protein
MEDELHAMAPLKQVLSGGRMLSGWLTISEAMLCLGLGMARQSFCGKMFGTISPPNSLFLVSFLSPGKKYCSIQEFLANMDLEHNFHTPLSPQAAQEYHAFHELVSNLQNSRADKDKWNYPWGAHPSSTTLLFSQFSPLLPLTGFGSLRLVRNSRFLYGWSSEIELTQRTSSEERVFWHLTAILAAPCVTRTMRRRLIICCFAVLLLQTAGVMWVSIGIMILTSSR